jgi:ABC-type sugar transport system permease subunit
VGGNPIGLIIALVLQQRNRLNYVLRLLWFLPAALPTIIAGYIWLFLYSPQGPLIEIDKNPLALPVHLTLSSIVRRGDGGRPSSCCTCWRAS